MSMTREMGINEQSSTFVRSTYTIKKRECWKPKALSFVCVENHGHQHKA